MNSENIYLLKVFTEIRHNPSLLYTEVSRLNKLANSLKKDFEDITYYKDKNLQLKNFDKKTIINFYSNRIVIDTDEPNYHYFKEITQKAVNLYNELFEVEPFNRVGLRFHWTIKFPSLKEATIFFINSFFEKLQKVAIANLGTIESGKIELRLAQDDKKYSIFINPIAVKSIEIRDTDKKEMIFDALLVDIDFHKGNGVSMKDFDLLLNEGYEFTRSKVFIIMNQLGVK